MDYVQKLNPNSPVKTLAPHPDILPCTVLHPHNDSCMYNSFDVLSTTWKKIFPLYSVLTFAPLVMFSLQKLFTHPLSQLWKAFASTCQSTLFLSAFCALYQTVVCMQRKVVTKDHRVIYWIAGIVSSMAILIEKKSRRAELALYVFPRALDSLYMILSDKKMMVSLPQGELLLFCLSLSGIMYFYEHEPNTMSPLLVWLLTKLLGRPSGVKKAVNQ